ncbi:MAG: PadR family transcriptional regulator [Chlamydiota bacterium]
MKKQKTKFVILGLLTLKPLSGYDIKKLIDKTISHFWSESNGQLYPTLKFLVKENFIQFEQKEQKGKKVSHLYSITKTGRTALENWLEETTERKNLHRDEDLLKLFFGKNTSPSACIELLTKREQRIKEKLEKYLSLQKELEALTQSPHHLYWNLNLNNGICDAEAQLRWCQESIQKLKEQGSS